jgi:dihydrofolate reductase
MRKLIWAINVTLDGYADHEAVIADDELHYFYADLLKEVDAELFGRKTYDLLESFWPTAAEDPESTKGMIEFAERINSIPKIVFSKTLQKAEWKNTKLVKEDAIAEVRKLKAQAGKSLCIGGISLANNLMQEGLIDEYWIVVQPIILGKGKYLFQNINERKNLKLVDMKIFKSGVAALHYEKIIKKDKS